MKRRDFLLTSALTVLGLSVSSSVTAGSLYRPRYLSTDPSVAIDSLRELGTLFSNLDHAKTIGRAYLQTQHVARRWDVLAEGVGLDRKPPHIPMGEHIRKHSSKDFAQGNTVVVKGWVLSRSEACACALLTLA